MKLIDNRKFLFGILIFGVIIACTQPTDQTPKQIAEEALHTATVRLETKDTDGDHLGYGSGFFVTRDQIVTHIDVVAGATSVEVELVAEGKKFAIEGITAFDTENKLVILKVKSKNTKWLKLDSTKDVQHPVYILGYPDGGEGTVRENPVSEKPNDSFLLWGIPLETIGGPVLNSQGKVIAVVGITDILKSKHIGSKVVEELLKKPELGVVEPLSQWQESKPIRPFAAEQLARKKGRRATVHLISIDNEQPIPLGSGFFVDRDKIVTNIHVVARFQKIQAKLVDTETYYDIEGVTAFDAKNDLAILKVASKGPEPLSLGDSEALQVGEPIAAVGNPEVEVAQSRVSVRIEGQITLGTIHSKRDFNKELRLKPKAFIELKIEDFVGYSGGPVLNNRCEVVGVFFFIDDRFGYAISSHILKALLEQQVEVSETLLRFRDFQDRETIRAYAFHQQGYSKYISAMDMEENKRKAMSLYKKAVEDLDKAIGLYGDFAVAYLTRGTVKYKLQKYKEAIKDFDQTIKLIPDREDAYNKRGAAKLSYRDYEGAMADFGKAIEFLPDYADAYSNQGLASFLWAKEQETEKKIERARILYQAAIKDFDKILKLKQDDDTASSIRELRELAKEALKRLAK